MPGEDPLLLETGSGATLFWRGIHFYPPGNPEEYACRKARAVSPGPQSLLFVPSIGLGHGITELLARLPADCAVLCVEVFQEVMGTAVARGLPADPRLLVVRTDDPEAAAAALRGLGTGRFRRVVEVSLSAGYRLAPELYARLRGRLEQEIIRYWQNRLTLIAMGSLQVRNILSNLPLLTSALDFSALSTRLPVVVAGAGPSLDESLPVLARQRQRYVLAAVDTALPSLTASGVIPDVVVALEAQVYNIQDFLPAPRADSGVFLACDLSSHPAAARLFMDRLCLFSSEFASLSLNARLSAAGLRPSPFPALGSVGVAAAYAALRLTDSEVYLTGMDLSFPGMRTHAKGSPHHIALLSRSIRLAPVDQDFQALCTRPIQRAADKNGEMVATDRVLRSYRDSLEQELQAAGHRVRDAGRSGLPLGARLLAEDELEQRLSCVPSTATRLHVDRTRGFAAAGLRDFVASERALLARVRALAGPPQQTADELGSLLREADYVWVHFPDQPDPAAADAGFLARVRVAAAFYDERLRRVESVL